MGRTPNRAWLWQAVVVAIASVPISSALGLSAYIFAFPGMWAANLWGDVVFSTLTAATTFGAAAVLLRAERRSVRRARLTALALVPAVAVATWITYTLSAELSLPNFLSWHSTSNSDALSSWAEPGSFLAWQFAPEALVLCARVTGEIGWPGILGMALVVPTAAYATLHAQRTVAPLPTAQSSATPALPEAATRSVAASTGAATPAKRNGAARNGTATDGHALTAVDPHKWVEAEGLTTTADVPLPELLIDEVIGQEEAVEVAKKAARQRRHLLLLGDPGTGKSMIAKAMAQILPPAELNDVLVLPNPKDRNSPRVQVLAGGKGREYADVMTAKAKRTNLWFRLIEALVAFVLVGIGIYSFLALGQNNSSLLIMVLCILVAIVFLGFSRQIVGKPSKMVPNLLIERPAGASPAPYVDGTGTHAGALLGDVRHDPFQSGGLETPTHLRVEPGAIHRAHKGLLFIDEINVLRLDSQQALLTAMQDRKYAITGQSERSSGAMTKTDAVPCDFILVAAGNMDVLTPTDARYTGLHPALRSRIRGYGYEVYVRSVMEDTDANRRKLVRFVAQEVRRDGQIPHFSGAAVAEVIREAQRRSGHTGKLTLRLRELGGLVRTAGDIARDNGEPIVSVDDVLAAKRMSMSLEHQVTLRAIEVSTAREAMQVGGQKVGTAIGCAFMGTGETGEPAGIVVPVEADATHSSNRHRGSLFVGGGLERGGVSETVDAVMKRARGHDMAGIDLHIQALLQQKGADISALGAAAALAGLSALEGLPVRQDTVVIGALAVNGRLRAVDGITQMVEGAADLGYATAIVPAANEHDILLEHRYRGRIRLVLAKDLAEAVEHAVAAPRARKEALVAALRGTLSQPAAADAPRAARRPKA